MKQIVGLQKLKLWWLIGIQRNSSGGFESDISHSDDYCIQTVRKLARKQTIICTDAYGCYALILNAFINDIILYSIDDKADGIDDEVDT